jgi:hypothetical protein
VALFPSDWHVHWRPMRRPGVQAAAVFLLFAIISMGYYGWRVLPHNPTVTVGAGRDITFYIWALKWWPYAIGQGLNPLYTHAVWAPEGYNLAWTTSIPAPSLITAPLTVTIGPLASYNLLAILAPALSGWAAFLLCRQISGATIPSLAGGYLFGFSSYWLAHIAAHLNLSLVFAVPLAVYLVLRRGEGRLGRGAFVALLAAVLLFQFGTSTEVFLTMTLFGGLTVVLAWFLVPTHRNQTVSTGKEVVLAYAIVAAVVSPYLWYAFTDVPPHIYPPVEFSATLLNFVVPSRRALLGGRLFMPINQQFAGPAVEQSAYVGLPMLLVMVLLAVRTWRLPAVRILAGSFLTVGIASLGPRLHLVGEQGIILPWAGALNIPVVEHALPARFTLFTSLAAAVMVSAWATRSSIRPALRWSLVLLAMAFLLPDPYLRGWAGRKVTPPFFARGLYAEHLARGENVLPLPHEGNSMLWQAQSDMYFRMATGYVGPPSPQFTRWPISRLLADGVVIPSAQHELRRYLRAHDVTAVLVRGPVEAPWDELLSSLGATRRKVGGMLVYRLPPWGAEAEL